jgi:hypothetical protein
LVSKERATKAINIGEKICANNFRKTIPDDIIDVELVTVKKYMETSAWEKLTEIGNYNIVMHKIHAYYTCTLISYFGFCSKAKM